MRSGQRQHGGPREADTWLVGGQARMLTTLPRGGSGPALDPEGLPRKGLMAQKKWPRPLVTPEYQDKTYTAHRGQQGTCSIRASHLTGHPQTRRPQNETGDSPRYAAYTCDSTECVHGSVRPALGCVPRSWALGRTEVPEWHSLLHTSLLHPVTQGP